MRTFLTVCAACFLTLGFVTARPASGDIYRYVDERGVLCFSDSPKHDGYRLYMREGRQRSDAVSAGSYYPYRSVIAEAASIFEVEEVLLRAVVEVESDYNQYAISYAGARGLMQLMPDTMRAFGVSNPWDPRQNIHAGTRYLKQLLVRFSGDLSLALAAYNAGMNAVIEYGSVPPYPQTERYVQKVLSLYRKYGIRSN